MKMNFSEYSLKEMEDGSEAILFKEGDENLQTQEDQLVSAVLALQDAYAKNAQASQDYRSMYLKKLGINLTTEDFLGT